MLSTPSAAPACLCTFHRDQWEQILKSNFVPMNKQGGIFTLFVGIAIFIACLGLFGLAAFSTERRAKDTGLRKTFGARTKDIIFLLLWQFSIPVLVANPIVWPVRLLLSALLA
jgi:putative ABC transport system permease protein